MAREKYKTLTEQMFYILLCLTNECCGMDIMEKVKTLTKGHIAIGPGTLYALLGDFCKDGLIKETQIDGRKRSYIITDLGKKKLEEEYIRLDRLKGDYEAIMKGENHEG